jgi:hypothetical protein
MNPSRSHLARMSRPAHSSAASDVIWTYSAEFCVNPSATSAVARIAAVAESAPTTRWRDDPKIANTMIGRRIV